MSLRFQRAGEYIPGDSAVHRLDPRTKLLGLLGVSASVLVLASPLSVGVMACLVLAGYITAGISLAHMARGLRAFFWLFLLTAFLQAFWTPGNVLWIVDAGIGTITITKEGIQRGLLIFLRLSTVIASATLVSATTSPGRLGGGLGSLLSPLRRLGIKAGDLVVAFSIGLQFLPILYRETVDIKNAQISRGIGHLDPNRLKRIACLQALVIPVIIRALRRSDELALAMVSRGYREDAERTSLYPLSFGKRDAAAGICLALGLAVSLLAGNIHVFQ